MKMEKAYWHTTAILWHKLLKDCMGESVKLTIGPSIENGFYYDFDVEKPISENDFEKIEEEMKKNNKEDLPLERYTLSRTEAIEFMKKLDEPYKVRAY